MQLGALNIETVHEQKGVRVERAVVGDLKNNVFVVSLIGENRADTSGDVPGVMIDATAPVEELAEWAKLRNVKTVLTTHNHHDHIGGIPMMKRIGASIGIGEDDANSVANIDFSMRNGDGFAICTTVLRAIHTPGHTPGSICFELEGHNLLFAGDTLFPGGPGKTNSGDDFHEIMNSLDKLFKRFNDNVVIQPGHGASTTFGNERPQLETWRERGW